MKFNGPWNTNKQDLGFALHFFLFCCYFHLFSRLVIMVISFTIFKALNHLSANLLKKEKPKNKYIDHFHINELLLSMGLWQKWNQWWPLVNFLTNKFDNSHGFFKLDYWIAKSRSKDSFVKSKIANGTSSHGEIYTKKKKLSPRKRKRFAFKEKESKTRNVMSIYIYLQVIKFHLNLKKLGYLLLDNQTFTSTINMKNEEEKWEPNKKKVDNSHPLYLPHCGLLFFMPFLFTKTSSWTISHNWCPLHFQQFVS